MLQASVANAVKPTWDSAMAAVYARKGSKGLGSSKASIEWRN